jgi:hypothetical protein
VHAKLCVPTAQIKGVLQVLQVSIAAYWPDDYLSDPRVRPAMVFAPNFRSERLAKRYRSVPERHCSQLAGESMQYYGRSR